MVNNFQISLGDAALINFYLVPLVCEAAPQIGCGCRTKPVLQALEANPEIKHAWLNKAGTTIAIQWRREISEDEKLSVFSGVIDDGHHVPVIQASEAAALFADLRSGEHWYNAETVDDLSRSEADIIGLRMADRITSSVALTHSQTTGLQCAIACAAYEILIDPRAASHEWRQPALNSAVVSAASPYLNVGEVESLIHALRVADYRPLPGEA